mgnify:CR=1 FL=1
MREGPYANVLTDLTMLNDALSALREHPTLAEKQNIAALANQIRIATELDRHFHEKTDLLFRAVATWFDRLEGNIVPLKDENYLSRYKDILERVWELQAELAETNR